MTSALKRITTAEGEAIPMGEKGFAYQYFLKDHLGNVRAVIRDDNTGSPEVIQAKTYYPFGMVFTSEMMQGTIADKTNPYLFNGKEQQEMPGLWYDYGFRIYDSRIAKFLSVDPLFKSYPWYTPYQFAGNKPIVAVDLDGLEELVMIYDHTVNKKEPSIKKIDYRMTKLGNGPLGKGDLTIHKYMRNITMIYIDSDPKKSFFLDVNPKDFVNPPDKINDDPSFKFTSTAKAGYYAEAGLSLGGLKIKVEGGAFQEYFKSEWSERGAESTNLVSDLKGKLGLGPFTLETDPYKNETSFEAGVPTLIEKYTYKGNTGEIEHTSTLTGEEDISILNFKLGAFIGAEFDLKKTNPIKNYKTNKWHQFLKDQQNSAK